MQALETPGLLIQELAPSSQHQLARAQKPFAVSVSQACHQARFEAPICITLQEMRTKLHKFDNARDSFLEGSLRAMQLCRRPCPFSPRQQLMRSYSNLWPVCKPAEGLLSWTGGS